MTFSPSYGVEHRQIPGFWNLGPWAIPSPWTAHRTGNGDCGLLGGNNILPPQPGSETLAFLFVLSGFFLEKHKHMAAAGAEAVFGWRACLTLPFAFAL